MTYNVDTQKYIDAWIDALQGVYAGENIPVLEGPAERVLALYNETKPTFICVAEDTTDFEVMDGFEYYQTSTSYRIEVYVITMHEGQADTTVKRARSIMDHIVGFLLGYTLQVKTYTDEDSYTVKPMQVIISNRERILEDSVFDGHFALTVDVVSNERLTC